MKKLALAENAFAVFLLCAMVCLVFVSVFSRKFFHYSFLGIPEYLQHCTLWIAFAGAAIAARRRKHLHFTGTGLWMKGTAGPAIKIFRWSISFGVAMAFVAAGLSLVWVEMGSQAQAAPFLPSWLAEFPMPLFMFLAGLHFIQRSQLSWKSKWAAVLLGASLLLFGFVPPAFREGFTVPGIALLFLAVLSGAPIFILLGGAALFLFSVSNVPISVVPAETYRMVSNPVLPAIPLFTVAGYVLAEGGASRRLVGFFRAGFGWMPGGIAVAAILACAFFTTFTGASGVTILALGGVIYPILISANYSSNFSLGLITTCGSAGLLFPPALPLILYAVIALVPIDKMFIAGILPGVLEIGLMACLAVAVSTFSRTVRTPFSFSSLGASVKLAKWDILLPVLILAGIFGGYATLVETAGLTALYAILLESVIHKNLKIGRCLSATLVKGSILIGGVMVILGLAFGFTSYLVDAEVPTKIFDWVREHIHTKFAFLITLNFFLIGVGCLMDIFSAIVVVVPILIPIALAYDINPIHLGIIFLINMEIGYLTPFVGLNVFLSAYRFGKPIPVIIRTIWPFLLLIVLTLILISFFPQISLFLVNRYG